MVLRHNLFEMSAGSEDGIDTVSRISLTLANADAHFSEIEQNVGWKGSRLTVRFVFFDLRGGTAASESTVLFRGVANPPEEITESNFRLSFSNRLSLQRVWLPSVRIQKRCPWTFPTNEEQREEAIHGGVRGQYSPFFRCGYSAGLEGGTGNLENGQPFTSCDYTRVHCEQRGMFRGESTRRFGGIEYLPASISVRSHGEQGSHISSIAENEARYNDFVPLVYGTAWYQPPIVFARNDGNLTRMEVLLGMGEMDSVVKVVVNGIDIPEGRAGTDMTATGWFNFVSSGNRTGNFNGDFADKAGNPLGDPYGSMAYMSVVVPNRISDGRSLPRVEVLAGGLKLEQFGADGEYLRTSFSNNPSWVLLDLLRRCGWQPDEINLATFARTAQHCDELIPAHDLHGNAVEIPRYQCNLVIRKRRSAADLVRGVRNGSGLYITYGPGGLLELHSEGSFAIQHPNKADGSNSTEKLNEGWPSYEFGDASSPFSGLLRRENGEPSLRFFAKSTGDSPNRYSVEFQDAFNEYQQDSLSLVHVEDVLSTGQEVSTRLNALGIPNFSQAARVIRRQLSKAVDGNFFAEFETSVRGIGLKPGDLITLTYLREKLHRAPFRVIKLAAGQNYRTLAITCQKHSDSWYSDEIDASWGTRRRPGAEVGFPRPLVDKFEIKEKVNGGSDGTTQITLEVRFVAPSKPEAANVGIPLLSLAPEPEDTGGQLPGGSTFYYAVSALDANGAESSLSFVVRAKTSEGTDTNRIRLTKLSFSAGTSGFHVYRGSAPAKLLRIASDVPPASVFEDTGLESTFVGPPDENYEYARFYWRLEAIPEHTVTHAAENSIGSTLLSMQDDEHAGLVVRITKGRGAGQERTVLKNDRRSLIVAPPWESIPDSTSEFVVAEAGWRTGAAAVTSPIEFEVPNREGASVHISGRSVNAQGRECAYDLSPLARWQIGGSSGEIDVPSQPTFGLRLAGHGTVEVEPIGFDDFDNTVNIQGATLSLHYWNELNDGTPYVLPDPIGATATVLELNAPGPGHEGSVIQLGPPPGNPDGPTELLVLDAEPQNQLHQVVRASFGTTAVGHGAQTAVYHLERKVVVIPFVKGFFGSRASGSFSHTVFLPDARIAAAELFVTNTRGNSETRRVHFLNTTDSGLRTLSGGQMSIQVEGYLAVQSNAAPPLVIEKAHAVRDVFAMLAEAPLGGAVELRLLHDGQPYCDLTIEAGAKRSNVVEGKGLSSLKEKASLTLDIVSVPTSDPEAPRSPGADLTVLIRL
jgi:hypothetical protein